jgi:hypothetical protein
MTFASPFMAIAPVIDATTIDSKCSKGKPESRRNTGFFEEGLWRYC